MRLPRALALAASLLLAACTSDGPNTDACYPGDFARVQSTDGAVSYEQCESDGGGYVPYDGDPTIPGDASSADAGTCSASNKVFMCSGCSTDSDCASGLTCFHFNNKGSHCTHACTSPTDCPSPSAGCGNQGVCKPQ